MQGHNRENDRLVIGRKHGIRGGLNMFEKKQKLRNDVTKAITDIPAKNVTDNLGNVSSQNLNRELKEQFKQVGWNTEEPLSTPFRSYQVDYRYDNAISEAQFGNSQMILKDILKFAIAEEHDEINLALLIVASPYVATRLGSGKRVDFDLTKDTFRTVPNIMKERAMPPTVVLEIAI